MEKEYLLSVANEIQQLLSYAKVITASWGISLLRPVSYDQKPAVKFHVNGFFHKGDVVIALNEGQDLYELYLLDESQNIRKFFKQVYLDQVTDILDREIETGGLSREAYQSKVDAWLENTNL